MNIDSIKIGDKKNTKLIAHRGLSSVEKENTCAAFVLAGSKSYFGIETDVHVTKDNKFIIVHDDNLKRVAGVDLSIENSNYDDLKKVKIFDKDDKSYRSDLICPDLEDYIGICKKYHKKAVLELKNPMKKEHIERIIKVINTFDYKENMIIISFALSNLLLVKEIDQDFECEYLSDNADEKTFKIIKDNHLGLDVLYSTLTKEYIEACHKENLKVNCWTCDDLEWAKKLISWDIDFITSNCLE